MLVIDFFSFGFGGEGTNIQTNEEVAIKLVSGFFSEFLSGIYRFLLEMIVGAFFVSRFCKYRGFLC